MDCRIVFYSARKTSLCERVLKKRLARPGITIKDSAFATSSEALGELVTDAFSSCSMTAVIGGLEFGDSRNTVDIMSSALSASHIDLSRKLKNDDGDDGYIVRSGNQLLLMLPDEPEQIEKMTDGVLSDYLKSVAMPAK